MSDQDQMEQSEIEPKMLFTYGTFRPADEDSPRNLDEDRLVGEGIIEGAVMFHIGGFPGVIPLDRIEGQTKGAIPDEIESTEVVGDLLDYRDMDDEEWEETLNRFDMIEGHPSMFKRERIRVEIDGTEYLTWTYFYNREPRNAPVITGGDWLDRSPRQNRF